MKFNTYEEAKAKYFPQEPDKLDLIFYGYCCFIMRMMPENELSSLHLNAYIAVPKGHPWYKKDYDFIDVTVHGGLTYCNDAFPTKPKNKDEWILGFDCAHFNDISPGYEYTINSEDTYRDIEFVKKELMLLAAQAKYHTTWRYRLEMLFKRWRRN